MFAYEICGVQFSIVCLFLNGVTKAVQPNRIPRDSGQIITAWCVVGLGLTISKNKFSKPKKMIFLAYNYHVVANILDNITKRV